jgi:adenine-specific DNA-methyltransferase
MYMETCPITFIITEYFIKGTFARLKESKMERKIVDSIKALHKILMISVSEEEKIRSINKFKLSIGLKKEDWLADYYVKNLDDNKEKGVIYTPVEISRYIVENTIRVKDIINNPYLKILDPACGCGSLIIQCFIHLVKLYKENLEIINLNRGAKIQEEEINKHIIDNNLFGNDIDETALYILQIDLFTISRYINEDNFTVGDFLIDNIMTKFDIIVGNPPYVGHKSIDKTYSELLRRKFEDVFRDKGDLSYCFFSRALECATDNGRITFITSRYFMESPSGTQLRALLSKGYCLEKIVDFYGIRPFQGIGIDPAIIFIYKESSQEIEIIRPDFNKIALDNLSKRDIYNFYTISFKRFFIEKNDLNDGNWVLLENAEKQIINKIEKKSVRSLKDVCKSYQGIITGCDKAFIVTEDIIQEKKLERGIIKPWIKSSHITNPSKIRGGEFIIYTNLIENADRYPNIMEHISEYKDKLMNRRECKNGVRSWYELQWGRNSELFEGEKIIFPYKSSRNCFALDKGSYFSADIYALAINSSMDINYDYLLFILNSSLYEFYFKTFAKKLGGNLYEYYPNNLMKLRLPDMAINYPFSENKIFDYFELTDSEINIIMKKGNQ